MGHPRKSEILVMNSPSADQIRQLFESLRRAPNAQGKYAPHKPLLLLLTLARVQQGQSGLVAFTEVEEPLRQLLTEFGPSSAPNTRHLPFWHLHTDNDGQLWTLQLPEALANQPRGTAPGITALRQPDVLGGFTPKVEHALKTNPALIVELARKLLDSTFPETLHEDIASVIGLELKMPFHGVQYQAARYDTGIQRRRDKTFRDRVLRAYEYRCCVCGFDLRLGHIPAGLEAAHIQWHTLGGPDIEMNGLSLCALHHKLFDLGAFTLEPVTLKVLFSQHALPGSRGLTGELRHHGQDVLLPVSQEDRPSPEFLTWNWTNVFKREARAMP
jgi:putative restriction endonuclease